MNSRHFLLFVGLTGTALAQGPLTPPPGADPNIGPVNALTPGGLPQATMKTLHQVEPRMAIPGGATGVVIGQSGAYYLTGNIQVATGDGITINASNVTLDLNGFSITTSATPAEGIGIRLGQGLRNVAIRNGNIGGDGVGGSFTGGVYYVVSGFPQPPQNLRVADLSVAASEFGISTSYSVTTCHVERCLVAGGSVHGIHGGIVKDCVVEGGPIFGRIVKDCSVTTPGISGIVAEVAENCYATSAGAAIQAKCLVNSYGTGGGDHDVISAGVAQNVWAEGGGGSGRGIAGTVVSNSVGSRASDLGGTSNGIGVEAEIVETTVGSSAYGNAMEAQIISASRARATNAQGIRGGIVDTSDGWSGTTTGVNGDVVAFSRTKDSGGNGITAFSAFGCYASGNAGWGIGAGVIGQSRADFSGSTGLLALDDGVIVGSLSSQNNGIGAKGGVISGVKSHSNAMGISSTGTVSDSLATGSDTIGIDSQLVQASMATSQNQTAIQAKVITSSLGSSSSDSDPGLDGLVVAESYGSALGGDGILADDGVVSQCFGISEEAYGIWAEDDGLAFGSRGQSLAADTGIGIVARATICSLGRGIDHGIGGWYGSNSYGIASQAGAPGAAKAGVTNYFSDGVFGTIGLHANSHTAVLKFNSTP